MSDKLRRFEIFIGHYKYLVFGGTKVDVELYPMGGILESDADILSNIIEERGGKVESDQITKDEKRFIAFITERECKEFICAIEDDRILLDEIDE